MGSSSDESFVGVPRFELLGNGDGEFWVIDGVDFSRNPLFVIAAHDRVLGERLVRNLNAIEEVSLCPTRGRPQRLARPPNSNRPRKFEASGARKDQREVNSNNIYENLDVDGGNKFKPSTPGDFIEIMVTKIERAETSMYKNPDGSPRVGLIFYGIDAADVDHEWSAWSAGAKRAVLVNKPEVGDFIRIEFTGETPIPGLSPKKNWEVTVLRRKGEVELDEHGLPLEF